MTNNLRAHIRTDIVETDTGFGIKVIFDLGCAEQSVILEREGIKALKQILIDVLTSYDEFQGEKEDDE